MIRLISVNYFTSKTEIKPQHKIIQLQNDYHYFTSKTEIKPQL